MSEADKLLSRRGLASARIYVAEQPHCILSHIVFIEPIDRFIGLAFMPMFHFDVREDQSVVFDEEGIDFPNLDAAEREAAEAAVEIGRDLLPSGKACAVSIEVRNRAWAAGAYGDRIYSY